MAVPTNPNYSGPARTAAELRAKYRYFAWSNPDGAHDDAYIWASLKTGDLDNIREFMEVFGLKRLQEIWAEAWPHCREDCRVLWRLPPDPHRAARHPTHRILRVLADEQPPEISPQTEKPSDLVLLHGRMEVC